MSGVSLARLFVATPLRQGAIFALDPPASHYLRRVLRLNNGDAFLAFNSSDGEWHTTLLSQGRALPQEQTRPSTPPPDLLYCFSPLKQAAARFIVQKAVELGAGHLRPVICSRTSVRKPNMERWRKHCLEAAEQCGLVCEPRLLAPVTLPELLDAWPSDRNLLFFDEEAPPTSPLAPLHAIAGKRKGLVIGPEGGFTAPERKALTDCPFVTRLSLGPRILRADTAAIAALALIEASEGASPCGPTKRG